MKLAIYTMYFPPDFGSATILMNEFAAFMTARGHHVTVITTIPRERGDFKFQGRLWSSEPFDGFRVVRIWTNRTPHPLGRFLAWIVYTLLATWISVFVEKADVLFMRLPPPTLGVTAALVRAFRRVKVVFNVQDIHPDLAIESGILKNPLGQRAALAFEKWVYDRGDLLAVISDGFRQNLESKGVSPRKIQILPNWVDVEFVTPSPKANVVSRALGLDSRFVVLYSGTITTSGFASLAQVLRAAALLADQDVLFAIVGEGIYKDVLQEHARALELSNVAFFPFRPARDIPHLLASADVALVPLDSNKAQISVPSKLYNLMSAGRAILALTPSDTEVARVIASAQCGVIADPDDARAIADAILRLKQSPELRERLGANGRAEAVRAYSRDAILYKYEELLKEL